MDDFVHLQKFFLLTLNSEFWFRILHMVLAYDISYFFIVLYRLDNCKEALLKR